MSKILNLGLCKSTFLKFNNQLMLSEYMENQSEVMDVFFQGFVVYKNVIHEDQCKLPHIGSKYRIHEILKSGWCIS
jgi:hypothetical protein